MPGQAQISGINGVAGVSAGTTNLPSNFNGASTTIDAGLDIDNCDTSAFMNSRLSAIDNTFYNIQNRGQKLSMNDALYAIRLNDFANTIKQ